MFQWISNLVQQYPTRTYRMIFVGVVLLGSVVMFVLATTQFDSKSNKADSLDDTRDTLIDFDQIEIDQNVLLRRRILFYTRHSSADQKKSKWQQDLQIFLTRNSPFYQNRSICADYWIVTFRFMDILLDTAHRLHNWCIVIVMEGDDYIGIVPPNVFRLTGILQQELAQISLFFRESLLLPKGLYTVQKNLGYLWAIFHQPTVIWDFDHINEILINQTVLPFPLKEKIDAWTITNYMKPLFNPYTCFQSNNNHLWPRGYPFQSFIDPSQDDPSCQISSIQWPTKKIAVIHSLIEAYTDGNSGYELIKPPLPLHLNIPNNESTDHPQLIVPRHAFSPYDQQTTLHLRLAFWGLYLPVTVEQQAADSVRSYVMQRLMWDADLQIAFAGTFLFKRFSQSEAAATPLLFRKSDNVRMAEKYFYRNIHKLVQFLIHWTTNERNFPKRIEHMFVTLHQHEHIKAYDLYLLQLWLEELSHSGYSFPSILA